MDGTDIEGSILGSITRLFVQRSKKKETMGFFRTQQEPTPDKLLVCLDLGSHQIKALAATVKKNGEKLVLGIEQENSEGIKRGVIINPSKVASLIRKVISRLEKRINIRIGKVYVGTGGINITSRKNGVYRLVSANQTVDDDLVAEMEDENQRLFHETDSEVLLIESQGFTLDNDIDTKDPVGSVCNRIDGKYLVIAAKKQHLNTLRKTINDAGVSEIEIIPGAYAASIGLLSKHEMEVGAVLVNMGAGTTQVSVFNGGCLNHMAVIPFAGSVLSNDLKMGWNIQFDQAEKLKCVYGSALPELENEEHFVAITGVRNWGEKEIPLATLAYVIEARLEEIFANVSHQIEISGCFEQLGTGIVLTGGSSKLKNMDAFVKKNTGLDACLGNPLQKYIGKDSGLLNEQENAVLLGLLAEADEDCAKVGGYSGFNTQPEKSPQTNKKTQKKKEQSSFFSGSLFDTIANSPKDVEF